VVPFFGSRALSHSLVPRAIRLPPLPQPPRCAAVRAPSAPQAHARRARLEGIVSARCNA
jgi:hypothetical protein